jgi:hypothetical protein
MDMATALGAQGLSDATANTSNPAAFVDFLRASGAHATAMGSQTIDGDPTTLYRATVNLNRYPGMFPASRRAGIRALTASLERETGSDTLQYDVWVDRRQLIRQLSYGETTCVLDQQVTTSVLLDLTSFGPQHEPALPAATETHNITGVIKSAFRRGEKLAHACSTASE